MATKKISIIVPVYKVEQYMNRCVESLIHQTYKNLEIILVDDGSPDKCPEMCDCWLKKDTRIKVIHKENGGLSDARNAGLKQATGEYVLYVDSDDYIDLDSCERFVSATLGQNVDLGVGNAIMEKLNGNKMMVHSAIAPGIIYKANEFIKKSIAAYQWYAPAWLNMYRREYLLANNLFFKNNIYFEDVQMLPRVFLPADKITCMEGVFYHYIIRENSIMTSAKDIKKKNDAIQNLREWKNSFDKLRDLELQGYLYGMLVKMYLYECRIFRITEWKIEGMDFRFALKYSMNVKEKLKVLFFELAPKIYTGIRKNE